MKNTYTNRPGRGGVRSILRYRELLPGEKQCVYGERKVAPEPAK